MDDSSAFSLAETVREIRHELEVAMDQGADSGLKFGVGPVEVELTVEARVERGGAGKLRIWVVDAGAEATNSDASLHRIKLVLHPVDAQGNPAQIASSSDRANW